MSTALIKRYGSKYASKYLHGYAAQYAAQMEAVDPYYEEFVDAKGRKRSRKRSTPVGLSKRDEKVLISVRRRAHYLDKGKCSSPLCPLLESPSWPPAPPLPTDIRPSLNDVAFV